MARIRFQFAITIILLLASQPAHGRSEYRLGGDDGNPWREALSGGGEYLNFDDQSVARRVQVKVPPRGALPYGDPAARAADFSGTSMRPLHIAPDINLVKADIQEKSSLMPLPLAGGRINVAASCFWQGTYRQLLFGMFDGDPATASFFPRGFATAGAPHPVIELGSVMPVNRIRFYPRLGRHDDLDLIRSLAEPSYAETAFPPDSFSRNVLSGYEIRAGGDDPTFIIHPCDDAAPGQRWPKSEDPLLEVVAKTEENLDAVVDLTFPTRYVRWIYFEPLAKDQWEAAEFEVFGEGFVQEMVYRTPILDFGRRVNWSKIRWSGAFPVGTQTEIRTRTGNHRPGLDGLPTPDPNLYFHVDVNNTPVPISREAYEAISVMLQQPIQYDTDNWTFWSPAYEIEPGRRDSSLAPEAWEDATRMIALGSSQYLQLEVKFISRFDVAPRLDQIAIQFSEHPAAEDVVGEIWPTEVASFEASTFTYVIMPTFEPEPGNTGFDRLEILTHTRADTVRSVKVDARDIDLIQSPPAQLAQCRAHPACARIEDDRIVVALPFLEADPDNSFKRIEVVFDVEVLRFGTQFTGWIYDSRDPDPVKQRVRPGNADFRFSSDDLSVRTPIGGDLLADLVVAPNPFTPNGDGVNDLAVVSYKLREVTAAREVSLEIYDLAGRLVYRRIAEPATHGKRKLTWNGRTVAGDLVTPGSYLYRLRLDVEDPEEHVGVVAVAY